MRAKHIGKLRKKIINRNIKFYKSKIEECSKHEVDELEYLELKLQYWEKQSSHKINTKIR